MLFPLIVISLLFDSCEMKRRVKGDLAAAVVFADEEVYKSCQGKLSKALERVIYTPQEETVFRLKPVPFAQFTNYSIEPNIIILGTLDGQGEVSRYAQGMLTAETRKGIEDGLFWFFARKDAWYRGQLLIVVLTNDKAELAARLEFGADDLFRTLQESALARLTESIYAKNERKEVAEALKKDYGIDIRVQHDYTIVRELPEQCFVQIRRFNPSRWLTITWQDADSLTAEMVIRERMRLGGLFADSCKIEPDYNVVTADDRIVPGGLLLRGLWSTAKQNLGGGPFFTLAVLDTASGKAYFLDGAVFNPGEVKLPFLQQLEVMVLTFKPKTVNREPKKQKQI